jgi:hypothetical protein
VDVGPEFHLLRKVGVGKGEIRRSMISENSRINSAQGNWKELIELTWPSWDSFLYNLGSSYGRDYPTAGPSAHTFQ